MEAFFLPIHKRGLFILLPALLLFTHCNRPQKQIHRSFYYWRTHFNLSAKEANTLHDLRIEHLYVRLFDVVWNDARQKAEPAAPIRFTTKVPSNILVTPVVFITNETIQQSPKEHISILASNIAKLMEGICTSRQLRLSHEVQIDCDWTAGTKDKYFLLINALRRQAFLQNKMLSCTIRLHQLKFVSLNGIPPADKGLLMCYNMGNLRKETTKNSIIEYEELKKYTANIRHYPLSLDVALPIFDWHVWFSGGSFKGLIHQLAAHTNSKPFTVFEKDSVINGIRFTKNDRLRYEGSHVTEVLKTAKHLKKQVKDKELNVILYHLSEENLNQYKHHELEDMYNSFR